MNREDNIPQEQPCKVCRTHARASWIGSAIGFLYALFLGASFQGMFQLFLLGSLLGGAAGLMIANRYTTRHKHNNGNGSNKRK